jgi:hypothetical protein
MHPNGQTSRAGTAQTRWWRLLLCLLVATVVLAHGAAKDGAHALAPIAPDISVTADMAGGVDHAGPGDHCGTAAQCHMSGSYATGMAVSGTWNMAGRAGLPVVPATDTLRMDDTSRRHFHPPRLPAQA